MGRNELAAPVRWGRDALVAIVAVSALAVFVWAVAVGALTRPPHYAEGCLLFNASRIREGLPLYVAAVDGAREYGEPPARYWVAYTPVYAAALAVLPSAHALVGARLVSLVAWYGAMARCVLRAAPESRYGAVLAALFVASVFRFASEAVSAKPDALALFLAMLALDRALALSRADAVVGALFAAATFLKPSVFGAGLGALVFSAIARRHLRGALAFGSVLGAAFAALQLGSGGVALAHLRSALALAFRLELAAVAIPERLPLILGLVLIAALGALQRREAPAARLGLAALVSSLFIAMVGLGKLGASTNYLMEPALVSVVLLSRFAPAMPRSRRTALALALAAVVTFSWSTNASARSLLRQAEEQGAASRALENVRRRCLDRPGALVVSSDPGTELFVNGRLYSHMIEQWSEYAAGRLPEALWAQDMQHPNVRCYVAWMDRRPATPAPPGLFPPAVAAVMRARFLPPTLESGYALYVARESSPAKAAPADAP